MPFEIPYTFIAGQTAKAAEVNSNFLGVKQFVDLLEQNSAQNELDIATLEANKANINGNSSYRFQVADAINTMDAVNLSTFNDLTANTKYYIGGFELSKQSTTSIRASAGSCWDSTNTLMITSTGNLTLNTSSAGNNVTRYIYVCWNNDTQAAQLTFSSNSSTPSLPSGYTYYRLIGTFTTDSDGNIDTVLAIGGVDLSNRIGFVGSYIGEATSTTVTDNVWLYVELNQNSSGVQVSINGLQVVNFANGSKWGTTTSALIPCQKGQTVQINKSSSGTLAKWYSMT